MKFYISSKAFKIIKHDDEFLMRTSINILNHFLHGRTLHKISSTRKAILKRLFVIDHNGLKVLHAACFLAFQTRSLYFLTFARYSGIDKTFTVFVRISWGLIFFF